MAWAPELNIVNMTMFVKNGYGVVTSRLKTAHC